MILSEAKYHLGLRYANKSQLSNPERFRGREYLLIFITRARSRVSRLMPTHCLVEGGGVDGGQK